MTYWLTFFIITIFVLAWSPWLSKEEALKIVETEANTIKDNNPDLCVLYLHEDTIRKIPFGYSEEIVYDCTQNNALEGVVKSDNTVFVTFYKGILGFPAKTLTNSIKGL